MKVFGSFAQLRQQYILDGPISKLPVEDRDKVKKQVQQGQTITEKRWILQAIAYAHFRARVSYVFACSFLVIAAIEGVAVFYSSFMKILFIFPFVGFIIISVLYFRRARLYRRSERGMITSRESAETSAKS